MIDHHDTPAGLAHAHHLTHHPRRFGHHAYHVEARHVVEARIGEIEIERVALAQLDVIPSALVRLLDGVGEHIGGRIDSDHVDVAWICIESDACADAHFKALL